jgi:hypothetical protein
MYAHYAAMFEDKQTTNHPDSNTYAIPSNLFEPSDIIEGIHQLKNNKAIGNSFISGELLKICNKANNKVSEIICKLFNFCIHKGLPPSWQEVEITSLYKKGNPTDPNNYRGLTIMGILPKLLGIVLKNKLEQ